MSIVETTTFRLAQGTDEVAFLAADRRVQTELVPNQPGFMRRTTARHGPDWIVVTLWFSEENAAHFESVARNSPVQHEFESCLNPDSVQTHRYETLD